MLAIIGGTGLTQLPNLEIKRRQVIRTPYGDASGPLTFGHIRDHEVVFLARHGYGHTIPPHEVNYRANMWALHHVGVTHVASIATVGGITAELAPGVVCSPDQIIDYTYGRKSTFCERCEKPVVHMDFTYPYCQVTRELCMQAAQAAGEPCLDGGTYAAVQGPRLETAAEINRLERDGATMVGMTGMPETSLAKEIGLCYAAIAVVANHAAGRGESSQKIDFDGIDQVVKQAMQRVRNILEQVVVLHAG